MADNIRYCKKCGAQLKIGAKFCKECGTKVGPSAANESAPVKPVQRTCPKCNKPVSDKAKFCKMCGYKFESVALAEPAATNKQVAKQEGFVAAAPGEFALMDIAMDTIPGAAKVKEVTSTFSAIGGGLKSFLAGIPGIFTNPGAMIMTVVLAGLWVWLGMNRGSDSTLVKALSWLTFSEGGFNRDEIGAIGGIAGKGVVGVVLASVFSGGIRKFGAGLGAVFGKTDSKRSVVSMIIGMLIGMLFYYVFVGNSNSTGATEMAGRSGAVLSLQALGSKNGNIYRIAEAFTSKKINGIRTAQDGMVNSLLSGIAIGFALATVLAPIVLKGGTL